MTALDTNLIAHDANLASQYLAGDRDVDIERGAEALTAVVNEHVNALLCHIEERDVNADEAYVRGLRNAARWLSAFDQPLRGFDQATCQNLARGLRAMADSAANRLGVEAEGEHSTPDDSAASVAVWAGVRPVYDGSCPDCMCCTRDDCNRRACAGGSCPCTEG